MSRMFGRSQIGKFLGDSQISASSYHAFRIGNQVIRNMKIKKHSCFFNALVWGTGFDRRGLGPRGGNRGWVNHPLRGSGIWWREALGSAVCTTGVERFLVRPRGRNYYKGRSLRMGKGLQVRRCSEAGICWLHETGFVRAQGWRISLLRVSRELPQQGHFLVNRSTGDISLVPWKKNPQGKSVWKLLNMGIIS